MTYNVFGGTLNLAQAVAITGPRDKPGTETMTVGYFTVRGV